MNTTEFQKAILCLSVSSLGRKEAKKYRNGNINKERYDYPEIEVKRTRDALNKLRQAKDGIDNAI